MVWVPGGRSGRQLVAALTATGGKDGATGAGSHPQAEAVRLGPATVVGLKGALAHGYLSTVDNCWGGARSFESAGLRPAAPANHRSGLSCRRDRLPTARPDQIHQGICSTNHGQHETAGPSRRSSGYGPSGGTVKLADSAPLPQTIQGSTRHADGGACGSRGLVGSAGKLLASGTHDSEPPSPPERLFCGATVSRRRGPLPFPLVHICG